MILFSAYRTEGSAVVSSDSLPSYTICCHGVCVHVPFCGGGSTYYLPNERVNFFFLYGTHVALQTSRLAGTPAICLLHLSKPTQPSSSLLLHISRLRCPVLQVTIGVLSFHTNLSITSQSWLQRPIRNSLGLLTITRMSGIEGISEASFLQHISRPTSWYVILGASVMVPVSHLS
jgi:hypothetical protein